MVAIVERDHGRSNAFTETLGTTRNALFAFAGSLFTAAIGAAFATNTPLLCVLAAGVLGLIGYIDSTVHARTRAVQAQLRRLEQVMDADYRLHLRGGESRPTREELARALAAVEIGQIQLLHAVERKLSLERLNPRLLLVFLKKHRSKSVAATWRFVRGRFDGFTTRTDLQTVFLFVLALLAFGLTVAVPKPAKDGIHLCVRSAGGVTISANADEVIAFKSPVTAVECPAQP